MEDFRRKWVWLLMVMITTVMNLIKTESVHYATSWLSEYTSSLSIMVGVGIRLKYMKNGSHLDITWDSWCVETHGQLSWAAFKPSVHMTITIGTGVYSISVLSVSRPHWKLLQSGHPEYFMWVSVGYIIRVKTARGIQLWQKLLISCRNQKNFCSQKNWRNRNRLKEISKCQKWMADGVIKGIMTCVYRMENLLIRKPTPSFQIIIQKSSRNNCWT